MSFLSKTKVSSELKKFVQVIGKKQDKGVEAERKRGTRSRFISAAQWNRMTTKKVAIEMANVVENLP